MFYKCVILPLNTSILHAEPGTLEFTKTSFIVKESIGSAVLPIIRNNGSDGKIEVTWKTKDIEATEGKDYAGGEGTLVFEHGEREKFIEIPIIDDQEYEKDESFEVELSDPTGGALLGRLKKTVVTIINDDGRLDWRWTPSYIYIFFFLGGGD